MTENEKFDPARSAAIRQMLVQTVARDATATTRGRAPRITIIAALSLAAVLIAGGSTAWALGVRPFPSSLSAPTPTHSQAPIETQTPTPTPTPSTTPVTSAPAPGPRVQLACADIYRPTDVAALVHSPVKVITDETTTPTSLQDIANAQYGVLDCEWAGGYGTELGNTAELSINIAPNATSLYSQYASGALKDVPVGAGKVVANSAGDQSGYWCEASGVMGGDPECRAEMLVGSYWASVTISASSPATAASTGSALQGILTKLAGQLRSAPQPIPQWVSPANGVPSICSSSDGTARVRSIFSAPGYTVHDLNPESLDAYNLSGIGRLASCYWQDSDGTAGALDIELLAGGSWVFPDFTPTPAVDGLVRSYPATTVPGASSALLGCAEGSCEGYFAIGTTLARIDFNDQGATKNREHLAALVAAIAKS
jgi:hypothetical protein